MSAECVFCAVLAGRSPASLVYEDDETAAFLDLFPVHPGHTLVVPKLHVTDLLSCPAELAGHLLIVSTELARAVVKATGAEGFNVWTANGRAAGQDIFHLHLHVLPRHDGDSFGLRFPRGYPREASQKELDAMAAKIRGAIRPAVPE